MKILVLNLNCYLNVHSIFWKYYDRKLRNHLSRGLHHQKVWDNRECFTVLNWFLRCNLLFSFWLNYLSCFQMISIMNEINMSSLGSLPSLTNYYHIHCHLYHYCYLHFFFIFDIFCVTNSNNWVPISASIIIKVNLNTKLQFVFLTTAFTVLRAFPSDYFYFIFYGNHHNYCQNCRHRLHHRNPLYIIVLVFGCSAHYCCSDLDLLFCVMVLSENR